MFRYNYIDDYEFFENIMSEYGEDSYYELGNIGDNLDSALCHTFQHFYNKFKGTEEYTKLLALNIDLKSCAYEIIVDDEVIYKIIVDGNSVYFKFKQEFMQREASKVLRDIIKLEDEYYDYTEEYYNFRDVNKFYIDTFVE